MKRPQQLTSAALEARLKDLCRRDDVLEAQLIEHLAEFIGRDLHQGHSLRSIFDYCTTVLGFSRDVAQKRIRAARAALVRPEAIERLRTRELTVSSLAAVAPVIEVADAFDYALGRSKRDVERYVAILRAAGKAPRRAVKQRSEPGKMVVLRLSPKAQGKLEKARTILRALASAESVEGAEGTEGIVEDALDALIERLESRLETEAGQSAGPSIDEAHLELEPREGRGAPQGGQTAPATPASVGDVAEPLGTQSGAPAAQHSGGRRTVPGAEHGGASSIGTATGDWGGELNGQGVEAAWTPINNADPSVPRLLSEVGAPRLGAFITLKKGLDTQIFSFALRRPFIRAERRVWSRSSDGTAGEPKETPGEPDRDAG